MRFSTYALVVAVAGLYAVSSDASFEAANDDWQGTSSLLELARQRLGRSRVELTSSLAWDQLTPSDGVLILHPESDLSLEDSSAFLASGGRLAIVDDYGRGDRVLRHYRLGRVLAPPHPARSLRDNPELAIATPAQDEQDPTHAHPIVAAVEQVITNHPTVLQPAAGLELTPILNIDQTEGAPALLAALGVIGSAQNCELEHNATRTPRTSAEPATCGRFFAMTDPSVFINLMLRYPGNRALALGLVDYLVADDSWGARGGKLYLLANQFDQSGNYAKETGIGISLKRWKRNVDEWLRELSTGGMPRHLALALAGLLVFAVALWAFTKVVRLQPRRLPTYTRLLPAVAQGGSYGRAAVLSAPTTGRALVVLELKAALEEALWERLALRRGSSHDAILEAARASGQLDAAWSARLQATLALTRRAEASVMTSSTLSFSEHQVADLSRSVREILAALC